MSATPANGVTHWFDAFPLETAAQAATAICQSWKFLASRPLHFNAKMIEPRLTKAIKIHVEQVTARQSGLLGMWAAENIIGVIDEATGELTDERRTDVTYGWTGMEAGFQLVFEFKKLTPQAKSRASYIGPSGMGRFVAELYSKGQPMAAMVGMLLDERAKIVPPLILALEAASSVAALKSIKASGKVCKAPSALFGEAEFDTEHTRSAGQSPIHIAHLFLQFPV